MSNGVVTQLGLAGKQDVMLSGKPEITFFKSQIRRHSVFASEPKVAEMQGAVGYDRRQICVIPRMGDLISKIYLYVKLGNLDGGLGGARYVDDVGRALIKEVSLEIGSVLYDKLYPEYMHAYEELTDLKEKQLRKLTGKSSSVAELASWATQTQHLWVPLNFWIMDDWGQSLPIVSLHLSEVKINLQTNARDSLIVTTGGVPYVPVAADATIHEMYIFLEVIFLSDAERKYMASQELTYIIGQVQSLGAQTVAAGSTEARLDLTFNHPTKELIWFGRTDTNTTAKNWFNFVGQEPVGEFTGELFKSATLKLNNNNRFENQLPQYFRVIQNKHHHERVPEKHIYVYSFSLYPSSYQVSGSCNMSRLDSTRLYLQFTAALGVAMQVFVFARSVNVISIGRGVSLLRYAS